MIEQILRCDCQKIGKSTIDGIEVEGFQTTDPAYYGDIVTPDQPDLILMRWRIEDNQYRVIFSDLTEKTVTRQQLVELENALPQKDSP
jgi:hypothetical protein